VLRIKENFGEAYLSGADRMVAHAERRLVSGTPPHEEDNFVYRRIFTG
jgi:hypothetical protein